METSLSVKDAGRDPFVLFLSWYEAAQVAGLPLSEAMALASVREDGSPSVRMVLMKECTPRGLVFCTNYDSEKGRQMRFNPNVAAVFHWPGLQRQVRIEGRVTRTSEADSDRYFSSRPRESQVGAWASDQSRVIPDREALENRFAEFSKRWPNTAPRPIYWGGYCLEPVLFEFWQGRDHRLHDRIRFTRSNGTAAWRTVRLAP